MLKKIIAAAAASTLAVSALAATASAASTQVVYEGYDVVDYVTVTIKGEVKNVNTALGFTNAKPKDEDGDKVKENYSSLEMIVKNGTGKDVKVVSGKINSEFTANTQDWDIVKGEYGSEKETTKKGEVAIDKTTVKKNKDTKATLKTDSLGDFTKYSKINSWVGDKTKITAELTLELTEDQFKSLYAGGLNGVNISDALNDAIADNAATASSPLTLSAKNKDGSDADQTNDLNVAWKISEAKVTTKKVIDWEYTYRVDDEATAWSRNDMRKMVNGGTVEFVFNNAVSGKDWVDGVIMFRNSNGQNTTVEADYTEETNSLKVEIPKNFFYSNNTNEYSLTSVTWGVQRKGFSSADLVTELGGDAAPSDAMKDLKITKVIFTANDKAPDNSGNNGGLVEDDNSKNDSTSNSTPASSTPDNTNSGSNKGDNANPSTGVAMAVAPVALAAAAAAVVISKKRK